MNKTKHRRLQGDLNEKISTRRVLSEQRRFAKDEFDGICNGIRRTLLASRHRLSGWSEGDDVAALLKCAPEDLRACGIDQREVKRAIEVRGEMADLQARSEALDAEITPLAQLVDALNRYVSEHANG